MGKQMNTQNHVRRIDFLQLSDAEKTSYIKEVKEILRQRIEEARANAKSKKAIEQ